MPARIMAPHCPSSKCELNDVFTLFSRTVFISARNFNTSRIKILIDTT